MLLVVTNKSDLTCDFLILRLKERGVPFRRLNTEDYGKKFQVNLFMSKRVLTYRIEFCDGKTLTEKNISSVYFRQPLVPELPGELVEEDHNFYKRETKEILRSLWRLIDRRKWLNHPADLWLASNKIEQLNTALRLGFSVPATCVSSSESIVRDFVENHKRKVICKAVKHGFLREGEIVRVAMTQRIGEQFLEQFQNYAPIPMIYQEEIHKCYDIRVTVVGNCVFSTAIHSQEYDETEVDWRHWDLSSIDLRHEIIKLPIFLEDLCKEITKYFNLKYSAIDLVKDVYDQYFFLEMNANGQWPWIEKKTGHPIRDALIDRLLYQPANSKKIYRK